MLVAASGWEIGGQRRSESFLGFTRARVMKLLGLLLLAPDLQARLLELKVVDGAKPLAKRTLRAVAHAGSWDEQRAAWQQARR